MTTEQIMMKLAQIRGMSSVAETKNVQRDSEGSSDQNDGSNRSDALSNISAESIEPPTATEKQPVGDAGETGDWSEELKAVAILWGGILSGRGVVINNTRQMSKKEYLKYTKGLSQDQVLEDPLLYIMFRAEEQGEANFFSWLDRFPKVKDESKQQK